LSRYGGRITPGFELRVESSLGTVWYTLDGEDPRAPSGDVSPTARALPRGAQPEPIALPGTVTIKARSLVRPAWSALVEASFDVDIPLRVTEIHYHPGDPPADAGYDDEDLEFVEIQNVGATDQDLGGVRLLGAVRFAFDDGTVGSLRPGELAVVARDSTAFAAVYPRTFERRTIHIAGEFEGELHNAGERIMLEGPRGEAILDFRYRDLWYPETDGGGRSLVIRDPRGDPETWGDRASWRPSDVEGGTPGADESALADGLQVPGDFNQDGKLDISDPVGLLAYLFVDGSAPLPCVGAGEAAGIDQGGNAAVLDSNGDGRVDLSDAIHTLSFLFVGGSPHVLGTSCVPIQGCRSACSP
jgi:hypothetical protein